MGIIAKGSIKSMSQDYHHQGIFSFSNGLEKSATHHHHHHHQLSESHLFHNQQQPDHHPLAHQISRDKLTVESFHDDDPPPLVPGLVEHHHQQQQQHHLSSGLHHVYQTPTTMLSEMFNFAPPAATAVEFPDQHSSFRAPPPPPNSAAAMHLFLMNPPPPPPPRSPSPPSSTSSTLHMLLPNPPHASLQGFEGGGGEAEAAFGQFSQIGGRIVEGQGLSLSLQSSSLQHLEEAAKAQELRIREGGFLYYNQGPGSGVGSGGGSASSILQYSSNSYRNSDQNTSLHNFQSAQVGLGSSLGVVNMLRNSKYVKAAQELLEEFCSVGRVQLKKNTKPTNTKHNTNPERNTDGVARDGGGSSSTSKDQPSLSTTDRIEHQRRKVKLLSMLDEVERRYTLYREQMQMVVNSFDLVMGIGAAAPYTTLTQKAMSRHFRCLKDAISVQLKQSCEVLGEKEGGGSSGITKGETPRLKRLDQSIRQQRAAFHQIGMMEQEAWRPQRGLPERSVTLLRAWLFEHFLHPYPSDADKHLLARQTGLSRNQVSNWFINARVRLWKPMVEEMYQLEGKPEEDGSEDTDNNNTNNALNAQNPMPPTTSSVSSPPPPPPPTTISKPLESDPEVFSGNQALKHGSTAAMSRCFPAAQDYAELHDMWRHGSMVTGDYGTIAGEQTADMNGATLIRFGTNSTTSGDVSLTLGLRHAGNMPEKTSFFGGS